MSLTATERARRVKIIVFDVDGVLTDGTIWLVPGPAGGDPSVRQQVTERDGVGFGVSSATMMEAKGYSRTLVPLAADPSTALGMTPPSIK